MGREVGNSLLGARTRPVGAAATALADVTARTERRPLARHHDAPDGGIGGERLDGRHHGFVHLVVQGVAPIRAVEREHAHPVDHLDPDDAGSGRSIHEERVV